MNAPRILALVFALVFAVGSATACGQYGPPVRGTPATPAVESGTPTSEEPECEEKEPS